MTTLIKNVLTSLGLKVGLIGTIQNEIMDEVIPAHKTTPNAYSTGFLTLTAMLRLPSGQRRR